MKKKKPTVSPEAAKILEQYRNAGKAHPPAGAEGETPTAPGHLAPGHPNTLPPPAKTVQRSGSRGK